MNTTRAVIALVTGANRGLGYATAQRLGELGATVLVGARTPEKAEGAVASLRAAGVWAHPVTLDVADWQSVDRAASQVADDYGRIDVLVNNAGVLPEAFAPEASQPIDRHLFASAFATNVFGAVATTQAFLPLLERSEAGRIVNVSSTMGSLVEQLNPDSPYFGMVLPAYQASKAALNALTVSLSKALADTSIKVNSVCPGWVQTDLGGPANRAAAPTTPTEAAEVVAALGLVDENGPTGSFVDREGVVAW
ncbi:SDR family oxidoreductase [Nocardioides sp.]|uniref:SDR family oxidoreductase n=1 Tax=Nocardioides sp. TaxID=35761 RepID=UPI00273352F5|nr:SDR family oxidoreductase [Nocardioides sp.]MDP3893540.1 SDR family oxidoreductase [Nocardioides sp.]